MALSPETTGKAGLAHMRIQPCPTDAPGVPAQSGERRRSGNTTMKYSLRKTPSHLHLAYKYGEASDGLMGRNFVLETQERVLTLSIDLTPNFHTRNKSRHGLPGRGQLSPQPPQAAVPAVQRQPGAGAADQGLGTGPASPAAHVPGARCSAGATCTPCSRIRFSWAASSSTWRRCSRKQPARMRAASPELHGISHA